MLLVIVALSLTIVSIKADCTEVSGKRGGVVVNIQNGCCDDDKPAPSTNCRIGWTYFDGSCYGFGNATRTWFNAAAVCASQASHLVEVNSAAENAWILSQLRAKNFGSIWMGATEELLRGTWVWGSSGDQFTFTDWSEGQPSDPAGVVEDCLEIRQPFGYKWNDWECGQLNKYMCETRPLPL